MIAYIGLGSNLQNPVVQLARARAAIHALLPISVCSSIYKSQAISSIAQPDFLNQVIAVQTTLMPEAVLAMLLAIEHDLGRVRVEHWGPRIIDCDLLLQDTCTIHSAKLQLPHPRLLERAFVIRPLLEIAPDIRLPDGRLVSDYLPHVSDQIVSILAPIHSVPVMT